jgi:hypothetical protein
MASSTRRHALTPVTFLDINHVLTTKGFDFAAWEMNPSSGNPSGTLGQRLRSPLAFPCSAWGSPGLIS